MSWSGLVIAMDKLDELVKHDIINERQYMNASNILMKINHYLNMNYRLQRCPHNKLRRELRLRFRRMKQSIMDRVVYMDRMLK